MKNPNFLKIAFLIIRVLVLSSATFAALALGSIVFITFSLEAIPSVIFYLIVIFPFYVLKRLSHLHIYFRVLFASTILNICLEYLAFFQGNPELYSSFLYTWVLLAMNVYIVAKYVEYKNRPELGNPIYEHKRFLIAGVTLTVSLLVLVAQMVLPFINIHFNKTPDGTKIFTFPSSPGYVTTLFTDQALTSKYELASNSFASEKLGCVILSRDQSQPDTLELKSQNKPVIKVEYDDDAPKTITVFNEDGSSIVKQINPKSEDGQPYFFRDQNGNFIEKNWRDVYDKTYTGQVKFYSLEPGMPSSYPDNQQFMAGDNFIIQLCEQFEYPVRGEGDESKTKKIDVPWSLRLKDSDGEIELIKSNYVQY